MIRFIRTRPLVLFVLLALVVGAAFLARPAVARDDEVVGWTVEQGGRVHEYLRKDRWQITFNANGIVLAHGGEQVTHHYYGTFRVIDRRK